MGACAAAKPRSSHNHQKRSKHRPKAKEQPPRLQPFTIPPIRSSPTTLEDSYEGKCTAFKTTLFPPPPETTPASWDNYRPKRWDWPALTLVEVQDACSSKVKSSTPGPDGINQEIVTAAYKAQPEIMFRVFSLLVDHGHHPACWKQATGVILKKPGKPDYSAPKAYRVISLLNCLGKVAEKLLAKRLGALAEVTTLLHPSQMGGRCKKSAVDACMLLLNRIQEQRKLGRTTSTVFLDIKGAFDHVAHNRLLTVLQKLGLPVSLIAWTNSFLTQRQLCLFFNGLMEPFGRIAAGIPQGSPISPILFLIYIRPLFESTTSFSVSYMDDISISVSSTSLRKNIRLLEKQVASLFTQGTPCAIQFDAAKTELIHFTTSQTAPTAALTLPDQTVVTPKEVVRWLSIHFDSALSFKDHVAIRTSQAKSTFFRMCRLANTERGLSPFAMRQLYMACVTSIANYGCQVHWKGQGSTIKQLQGLLID